MEDYGADHMVDHYTPTNTCRCR